ncbi:MAG: heat-inducible transcriptional repressor HrcA [Erysipelotrichaceae bacterium]|nr:heat-inducible transcriptional repressor HrcA [Erysipelotrichaceae bacterium]MDD3923637.1 heat-inducible transcriptional repressor HrcA [Erysipelotrichaceae bacterium]MDD4641992.1 heat-inducible transcriptional repressor HrcA [Erysipelotrichaceae bacterium]
MLSGRLIEIFKAIVEDFIQTAEPVGSKTLVDKYHLPYSTATIRNEMMELENLGLIEKTHTSSGRVPSIEGYRFYVENLMKSKIDDKMALVVQSAFADRSLNVDELIKKSCDILSKMTNLTSIVLGPDAQTQRLEHIKLFVIDEKNAVAVFITDTGHTENKMFQFDEAISVHDIQVCCDILNDRLKGTYINEVVEKMNQLKPLLESAIERHEVLFKAFVAAFIKFANENFYYSGQDKLMYQPEFADIERLKELMGMLENSQLWRDIGMGKGNILLKTSDNSQLVWVDDMAVVSSRFKLNSEEEAQLMLVGPSRMDYDHIVSLIEYLAESIEKMLNQGGRND